jgi:WxL domain surface cell wall-binding
MPNKTTPNHTPAGHADPRKRPALQAPPVSNPSLRGLSLTLLASACVLAATLVPSAANGATQEDHTQFSVIAGSLSFSPTPALPTLSSVTLNGQAQTTGTSMTSFGVADATGSCAGWNVTVEGQGGTGKSATFALYCAKTKCGSESEGYVSGGQPLPADSLTLSNGSGSFAGQDGTIGTAPTLQCSTSCAVDSPTPVKIASAATNAGMGTWQASGFGAGSLVLSTPSTLKVPPNEEIYRVNLLWTLSTGP